MIDKKRLRSKVEMIPVTLKISEEFIAEARRQGLNVHEAAVIADCLLHALLEAIEKGYELTELHRDKGH